MNKIELRIKTPPPNACIGRGVGSIPGQGGRSHMPGPKDQSIKKQQCIQLHHSLFFFFLCQFCHAIFCLQLWDFLLFPVMKPRGTWAGSLASSFSLFVFISFRFLCLSLWRQLRMATVSISHISTSADYHLPVYLCSLESTERKHLPEVADKQLLAQGRIFFPPD